jgi:hypothetical protein
MRSRRELDTVSASAPWQFLVPLLVLAPLGGCATVINGTTQNVEITSSPPGATAVVLPQNVVVTTPASISLERNKVCTIVFDSPGYEQKTMYVNKQLSTVTNGNVILGGAVGIATDLANGAAFVLVPDPVHAEMTPIDQGLSRAAPSPDAKSSASDVR